MLKHQQLHFQFREYYCGVTRLGTCNSLCQNTFSNTVTPSPRAHDHRLRNDCSINSWTIDKFSVSSTMYHLLPSCVTATKSIVLFLISQNAYSAWARDIFCLSPGFAMQKSEWPIIECQTIMPMYPFSPAFWLDMEDQWNIYKYLKVQWEIYKYLSELW